MFIDCGRGCGYRFHFLQIVDKDANENIKFLLIADADVEAVMKIEIFADADFVLMWM